jgi:hypothetical protein
MGAVGVRYWKTRNLAVNAALALALGSGRQGLMALDTYFGAGPIAGVTLLLGNWRHLAVGATPEASYIYFRPGGGLPSTKLISFRAQLAPLVEHAVVCAFGDPDTAAGIDVHISGITDHRFRSKQGNFQTIGNCHGFQLFARCLWTGLCKGSIRCQASKAELNHRERQSKDFPSRG